jgi:hypothetical protein
VPSDGDALTADWRTRWAVEKDLVRIGKAVNRIPTWVFELFSERP